jgi:hypothetical protein
MADFVGYARTPVGAERIIHGECTVEYPAKKFSEFAKRTNRLKEHLGLETGAILPVVFVRSDTTAQDRRAASELGLVLCDGGDIRQLQDKIRSDAIPEEVFEFLRSLAESG